MKRIGLAVAAVLALSRAATATELPGYDDLQTALGKAVSVVEAWIREAKTSSRAHGPNTLDVLAQAIETVAGAKIEGEIRGRYEESAAPPPTRPDMHISYANYTGSGQELRTRAGDRVLLLIGGKTKEADAYVILRVEPPESRKAVEELFAKKEQKPKTPASALAGVTLAKGMMRQQLEKAVAGATGVASQYNVYTMYDQREARYTDGKATLTVRFAPGGPAPWVKTADGHAQHLPPLDATVESWELKSGAPAASPGLGLAAELSAGTVAVGGGVSITVKLVNAGAADVALDRNDLSPFLSVADARQAPIGEIPFLDDIPAPTPDARLVVPAGGSATVALFGATVGRGTWEGFGSSGGHKGVGLVVHRFAGSSCYPLKEVPGTYCLRCHVRLKMAGAGPPLATEIASDAVTLSVTK